MRCFKVLKRNNTGILYSIGNLPDNWIITYNIVGALTVDKVKLLKRIR